MTNENRLIFLCAEHFQICHFHIFFFSVVSPLSLKKSSCILCMPGQEFRSLTWKLLLKYVVFCSSQTSFICLQEVKLIMFPLDHAKQKNNLVL